VLITGGYHTGAYLYENDTMSVSEKTKHTFVKKVKEPGPINTHLNFPDIQGGIERGQQGPLLGE
jgi:hypothetical protein